MLKKRRKGGKRLKLKGKQEEKQAGLLKKQKLQQENTVASRKPVNEANYRLKKSMQVKKISATEVAAAQALLESRSAKPKKSSGELKAVSEKNAAFKKKGSG